MVVYTPRKLQIKRLIKRDNLDEEEAIRRIDSHIDIEKKKRLANFVIDNSKDFEHLKKEVDRFYANIKI